MCPFTNVGSFEAPNTRELRHETLGPQGNRVLTQKRKREALPGVGQTDKGWISKILKREVS